MIMPRRKLKIKVRLKRQEKKISKRTVYGTLMANMTSSGKNALKIQWTKVKGADGYDIFFTSCKTNGQENTVYRKIKTIKGNQTLTFTKTGLKKNKPYKAYIRAFCTINGKKVYVRTSAVVHCYTAGFSSAGTNPKTLTLNKTKVTLKKGKTFRIKATVTGLKSGLTILQHHALLRYISTNKKVAIVTNKGQIKAVGKGNCKVYVFASNGLRKAVTVKVK